MRRLRTFGAVLLLLVLLATGCSGDADALARIREAGVLRVALDPAFPPFEFVDGAGALVGLDVELAGQIGQRLQVEVQFISTGYDALYDALTVGQADIIISALYPDPYRSEDFAFSQPYFNAGSVAVVPAGSPITGPADFAGQRVLVAFGTEGHMEALRWQEALVPAPEVLTFETSEAALDALVAGLGDAAIVDNIAAQTALAHGQPLTILDPPLTDEIYVVAGRREDAALVEAVGAILQDMQSDGSLSALIARWMR